MFGINRAAPAPRPSGWLKTACDAAFYLDSDSGSGVMTSCFLGTPGSAMASSADSKESGEGSICAHGRKRYICKECGGAGICEHGRVRSTCVQCPAKTEAMRARVHAKEEADARRKAKALEAKPVKPVVTDVQRQANAEARAEAKTVAKAVAKAEAMAQKEAMRERLRLETLARQQQAASHQRQLFREAASRQQAARDASSTANAPAACSGHTTPAGCVPVSTVPPFDEIVDALVAQVLRDSGCPSQCLGVEAFAPADRVRKRYLHLALRLHPDKTSHPNAHLAFAAVENAYGLLSQI